MGSGSASSSSVGALSVVCEAFDSVCSGCVAAVWSVFGSAVVLAVQAAKPRHSASASSREMMRFMVSFSLCCYICYTGKGPRITGLAGGKKAAPSIGKRGLTAQGNLPRRIRRLEAGFRQGAFFGRYPSAPHTAGLLAYASKKPRLLTFAMAYCGSLDDYSDRIARDSHPIPYSPSPVGKGTARGYSI